MIHEIMNTAAQSGNRHFEILERVTTNVANVNTNGYKVKRFEQFLMPDGRVDGIQRVDYTPGAMMVTKRELDVAIQGAGFIPVTQPDGTTAYTRNGSFMKNQDGMLVTNFGDIVGEGIQLPVNYEKIIIQANGDVEIKLKGKLDPKKIGQIKLMNFPNPEGLKNIGYNKLIETEESGKPVLAEGSFKQGTLERSNVSVFYQVDQVLRMNAAIISNFRMIKFSDELFRQSVNLKQ